MEADKDQTVTKPLLLLTVDGPINPYQLDSRSPGDDSYAYTRHLLRPRGAGCQISVLISEQMGADLADLASRFDIVWVSPWHDEANRLLSPLLGLPSDLPVLVWPRYADARKGSWKMIFLLDRLFDEYPGRPWVFVDSEVRAVDRMAVRRRYGEKRGAVETVRRLLLEADPFHGLRRSDVATLRTWADS